jgi:hypothetical protein
MGFQPVQKTNFFLSGRSIKLPSREYFAAKNPRLEQPITERADSGLQHGDLIQRRGHPSQSGYVSSSQDLSGRHTQYLAMVGGNNKQTYQANRPPAPSTTNNFQGHSRQRHHQPPLRA